MLKKYFSLKRDREAFSLMMAIVVIVVMGVLTSLVSNVTDKMAKETTVLYQKEQSILLAKSYTEYAIMAVSANDRVTGECIETINGVVGADPASGNGYNIKVNISYIGDGDVDTCNRVFSNGVTDQDSKLNVIIDVYVTYREINQPNKATAPWLTYHKRSVQKI